MEKAIKKNEDVKVKSEKDENDDELKRLESHLFSRQPNQEQVSLCRLSIKYEHVFLIVISY